MLVGLSGIDGVGKTSLSSALVKRLTGRGIKTVYSRPRYKVCKQFEHSIGRVFESTNDFDKGIISTIYFNGLMIDWFTHYSDFLLNHPNAIVIADRYLVDVLAQGLHIRADVSGFSWLSDLLPPPDISYLITSPVSECAERIKNRSDGKPRKFEEPDELTTLNQIYNNLILEGTVSDLKEILNSRFDSTVDMMESEIYDAYRGRKNCAPPINIRPLAPLCSKCENYIYP
jgi:thymidylate kinase